MAIAHPSSFRLSLLRIVPDLEIGAGTRAASALAFERLCDRFTRLDDAGLLGGRDPTACATAFNALCEGMATTELRGTLLGPDPDAAWRDAFTALVAGFATPADQRPATSAKASSSRGMSGPNGE